MTISRLIRTLRHRLADLIRGEAIDEAFDELPQSSLPSAPDPDYTRLYNVGDEPNPPISGIVVQELIVTPRTPYNRFDLLAGNPAPEPSSIVQALPLIIESGDQQGPPSGTIRFEPGMQAQSPALEARYDSGGFVPNDGSNMPAPPGDTEGRVNLYYSDERINNAVDAIFGEGYMVNMEYARSLTDGVNGERPAGGRSAGDDASERLPQINPITGEIIQPTIMGHIHQVTGLRNYIAGTPVSPGEIDRRLGAHDDIIYAAQVGESMRRNEEADQLMGIYFDTEANELRAQRTIDGVPVRPGAPVQIRFTGDTHIDEGRPDRNGRVYIDYTGVLHRNEASMHAANQRSIYRQVLESGLIYGSNQSSMGIRFPPKSKFDLMAGEE